MIEEINKAITILQDGGLILYPTDTGWAIGCDATNETAVEKMFLVKKSNSSDLTTCLVANDAMLEKFIENIPEVAYDLLDLANKPTTIIYEKTKGIALNLLGLDNVCAVRIPSDKFCQYLINKFKKPITASPAHIEGVTAPKSFKDIQQPILKGVMYVVNLQEQYSPYKQDSVIKLSNNGVVKIIRE